VSRVCFSRGGLIEGEEFFASEWVIRIKEVRVVVEIPSQVVYRNLPLISLWVELYFLAVLAGAFSI